MKNNKFIIVISVIFSICVLFCSCEKNDVELKTPPSKTVTLIDDSNGSSVTLKISCNDTSYLNSLDEKSFTLFTDENEIFSTETPLLHDENEDECTEYSEQKMVECAIVSKNIKTASGACGIRLIGNQLKACMSDYSGYFYRFYSSNPPYYTQDCSGVRVRNESGSVCNNVKVKVYQNNISTKINEFILSSKYQMVWTYPSQASWIFVDCYWKNTKAHYADVSLIFI